MNPAMSYSRMSCLDQTVTKKTQLQRYLTKKYDVLELAGIEKLVRKGTDVIYYCTTEELYRLIKTAHSARLLKYEEVIGRTINLLVSERFFFKIHCSQS
jgi:hypothetical protein